MTAMTVCAGLTVTGIIPLLWWRILGIIVLGIITPGIRGMTMTLGTGLGMTHGGMAAGIPAGTAIGARAGAWAGAAGMQVADGTAHTGMAAMWHTGAIMAAHV